MATKPMLTQETEVQFYQDGQPTEKETFRQVALRANLAKHGIRFKLSNLRNSLTEEQLESLRTDISDLIELVDVVTSKLEIQTW